MIPRPHAALVERRTVAPLFGLLPVARRPMPCCVVRRISLCEHPLVMGMIWDSCVAPALKKSTKHYWRRRDSGFPSCTAGYDLVEWALQ